MADEDGNGYGATAARSYSHQDKKKQRSRRFKRRLDSFRFLPDEILRTILSYLPTEIAIKTSILSKRWRHVWSDTPCLYLDWTKPYGPKGDIINKILDRYKARKMMSFNLKPNMRDDFPYIDRWIEFAMSRNVENMSLEFRYQKYLVPDFFYISNSLKQLSLELDFCGLKPPSFSVSWTSLKTLSLRCCKLSDECIDKILSGCPVLESLTLHFCDKLLVLDLSKSLSLRTLVIDRNIWVPGPTRIIAPHIHCLSLINSQLPCTLVDVSSLKEARMEICFCAVEDLKADFLQAMVLEMLKKLQHVDKLTFGENFLTVCFLAFSINS
ncbi:putative F-box/LRR-repeat protein [Raphanus sativus]|nr:putative F-box/LRR-repeat protein [Raphanus sativus]